MIILVRPVEAPMLEPSALAKSGPNLEPTRAPIRAPVTANTSTWTDWLAVPRSNQPRPNATVGPTSTKSSAPPPPSASVIWPTVVGGSVVASTSGGTSATSQMKIRAMKMAPATRQPMNTWPTPKLTAQGWRGLTTAGSCIMRASLGPDGRRPAPPWEDRACRSSPPTPRTCDRRPPDRRPPEESVDGDVPRDDRLHRQHLPLPDGAGGPGRAAAARGAGWGRGGLRRDQRRGARPPDRCPRGPRARRARLPGPGAPGQADHRGRPR